jgi:cysteine sulfinate desulfinase/cysteine desulfurase-like protein
VFSSETILFILVSTGSACGSNKLAGSHVLKAIGVGKFYLNGNIRISLDSLKVLTREEEDFIIRKIKENVEKLIRISPFKFNAK